MERPLSGFPKARKLLIVGGLSALIIACGLIAPAVPRTSTPTIPSISADDFTPAATGAAEVAGRIAFESTRDGNLEIYVMNADGSRQTRLTDNPASDSGPSWSPDVKKIAFSSNRDGNWQIYSMNADGSNQTRLTNDDMADDAYPTWSPDGQKIAFTSNRVGNLEIYVINADGSRQIRFTNNKGDDSFPDWSPDGQKIVFQSTGDAENGGDYELYTINAFGSARTRLGPSASGRLYPSWSPDGKKIAYLAGWNKLDSVWGIEVINADGSEPVRLTKKETGRFYPKNYAENSFPAWSGDGQKIAFASGRDGNAEIYTMNADGSQPTRLTHHDAYDGQPDWSPLVSVTLFTPAATSETTAGQTPKVDALIDPNLACALHRVTSSKLDLVTGKISNYALSCLDKDGWRVYKPETQPNHLQAPSWLAHLPTYPWAASLTPLHFPGWMAQCPGGRTYLVLKSKLYMLEGEQLTEIGREGDHFENFTCGQGNDIWAAVGGVSHFDGSIWTRYPASDYLGRYKLVDLVKGIAVAPNGDAWIATADGISKFDGTGWQVFASGKDFEEKYVPNSIAVDANGDVWVVFNYGNNYGLLKYDSVQSATFWGPKGLSMSGITFDHANNIWAIIGGKAIYMFDPQTKRWALQFDKDTFGKSKVTTLQFDRQDRLWVNTNYGIYVHAGSGWSIYQMHTADLYANQADAILVFGNGPSLPAPAQKALGSVQGKLTNPDPATYAKKRVQLCSGPAPMLYSWTTPCADYPFQMLTTVDSEGNFAFADVPVGKYHIAIEVSTQSWVDIGEFMVDPGAKTDVGEIAYPPETK